MEAGAADASAEIHAALQKGRRWSAWALSWPGVCGRLAAVDCASVEQSLREELSGFFQEYAVAATPSGAAGDRITLRVSIVERSNSRSVTRKTTTVYLVHFLRSDLVLASTIKVLLFHCGWLPKVPLQAILADCVGSVPTVTSCDCTIACSP